MAALSIAAKIPTHMFVFVAPTNIALEIVAEAALASRPYLFESWNAATGAHRRMTAACGRRKTAIGQLEGSNP
jgi:hypothetical protein